MEAAPAAAANAGGAPAASSAEHTANAQASAPPQVNVNANGNPGTTAPAPAADGKPSWTDTFDADSKEYIRQKGFADQKALLESYRNLEKLRGVPQERLLKLPEASDEKGMAEVFEKLGKPATAEGYGLQPKDPNNPGFTNWAKDTFLKLNLTAEQGQKLVEQFNAFNEQQEAAANEEHTNKVQGQVTGLKKEWGAAYNQNVAAAQAAYRRMGIPDAAVDSLEKSIGFDGVMKLFHSMGTKIGEHSFVGGEREGFGEGAILSPVEAQARIKALKADQGFIKRYTEGDTKARQEMERLHKMAHPTD